MQHLLAFSESHAASTLEQLTPVSDAQVSIQNNGFQFDTDVFGFWAMAMNADLVRAKIRTPSIDVFPNAWIRPIEGNAQPGNDPSVMDFRQNPLRFKRTEQIVADAFSDQAMGNQRSIVLLGVGDTIIPAPAGERRVIRGTATDTLTANAWSLLSVTWEEDLPEGNYHCVGLEAFSTGAVAARIIFQGQQWYPGTVAMADTENRTHPIFLDGKLGSWGTFTSNIMPRIQMLSISADTAETVYLHYVKLPGSSF